MYDFTAQIKVTVPASQTANSVLQATIVTDPRTSGSSQAQVPMTEVWIIDDVYVKSAQSIDLLLNFKKNGRKTLSSVGPVNTLVVSNPSRPRPPVMGYEPGSIMSIDAINLDAGGSADTTETVYAHITVLEKGKDF